LRVIGVFEEEEEREQKSCERPCEPAVTTRRPLPPQLPIWESYGLTSLGGLTFDPDLTDKSWRNVLWLSKSSLRSISDAVDAPVEKKKLGTPKDVEDKGIGLGGLIGADSCREQKKPYTAVTVQIERLTSEQYEEDDSSGIPDLVEVIRIQSSGPTEAARALRKKLYVDVSPTTISGTTDSRQ
jgi:hypothetical protein